MPATHLGYDVPSGGAGLSLDTGISGSVRNLRFIFGGRPQTFLITRVVDYWGNGALDMSFEDTNPHEATVFFAKNPVGAVNATAFVIGVINLSSSTEPLQVTALYDLESV